MKHRLLSVIAGVLVAFSFVSAQDAVILQPGSEGKDAFVDADFPNQNYGNETFLYIGKAGAGQANSYIQFDVSPYSGKMLDSCFLDLSCESIGYTVGYTDTTLVAFAAFAWDEMTINWDNRPLVFLVDSGVYTTTGWWTWDVTQPVQDWLDGLYDNNGFGVGFLNGGGNDSYASFNSGDNTLLPLGRPRLRLYFKSQKSITVTSPNGGENWQVGTPHVIKWNWTGPVDSVVIEFVGNGTNWLLDTLTIKKNTGAYSWTIPDTPGDSMTIFVADIKDYQNTWDCCDNFFTISTSPAVSESPIGEVLNLQVQSCISAQPVIQYQIPTLTGISLKVYGIDGRMIRDLTSMIASKTGTIVWDGRDESGRLLPEGSYIGLLAANQNQKAVRLTLVRRGRQ